MANTMSDHPSEEESSDVIAPYISAGDHFTVAFTFTCRKVRHDMSDQDYAILVADLVKHAVHDRYADMMIQQLEQDENADGFLVWGRVRSQSAPSPNCGVCGGSIPASAGLRFEARGYTLHPTGYRVWADDDLLHQCGEDVPGVPLGTAPRPETWWQGFWHHFHHGRLMRFRLGDVLRFSWQNRASWGCG